MPSFLNFSEGPMSWSFVSILSFPCNVLRPCIKVPSSTNCLWLYRRWAMMTHVLRRRTLYISLAKIYTCKDEKSLWTFSSHVTGIWYFFVVVFVVVSCKAHDFNWVDPSHITPLAALPAKTPSYRVWSRNGRGGCSGMPHVVIAQVVFWNYSRLSLLLLISSFFLAHSVSHRLAVIFLCPSSSPFFIICHLHPLSSSFVLVPADTCWLTFNKSTFDHFGSDAFCLPFFFQPFSNFNQPQHQVAAFFAWGKLINNFASCYGEWTVLWSCHGCLLWLSSAVVYYCHHHWCSFVAHADFKTSVFRKPHTLELNFVSRHFSWVPLTFECLWSEIISKRETSLRHFVLHVFSTIGVTKEAPHFFAMFVDLMCWASGKCVPSSPTCCF